MRSKAHRLLAVAFACAGAAVTSIAAAAPVTVDYPSTACPDTGDEGLQQCIDAVDAGSTIILTSEIIDEIAGISKSLTLRAADRSLRPVLQGIFVAAPDVPPPVPVVNATVEDIRFTLLLGANFRSGSGHTATFRRVELGKSVPSLGMELSADVPASFTLEESFVRTGEDRGTSPLMLIANDPNGLVRFRIVGNRINARGNPDSGSGIRLSMEGAGSVRADIFNNVISDVATCVCGAASGIAVLPNGAIRADVNIVGNTIDGSRGDAIQQRNDLTTGRLALDVFNNIFSHTEALGLRLETGAPGTLAFRAGFNNFFQIDDGNFLDGQSLGPGNATQDPRYVDRSSRNFRLRSNSPLIDKGAACSPGGLANPDAAGKHRLRGASVDIGAYEQSAPGVTGIVRLGTDGANALDGSNGSDIICGFGGPDILRGLGGADYIDGGVGPDRIVGGLGADRLLGSSSDDLLCARDGAGGDRVDGGTGTDTAHIDAGDIRVSVERSRRC